MADVCPDSIEPVVAWRAWRAVQDDPEGRWTLRSVIHPALWEPGQRLEALCAPQVWAQRTKGRHMTPNKHCSCGIYAAFKADALMDYAAPYSSPMGGMWWGGQSPLKAQGHPELRVFGSVKLWGKVVQYEKGYKGLYAYPSRLWVMGRMGVDKQMLDDVAWSLTEYRVPVGFVEGGERAGVKARLEVLINGHEG